MKMLFMVIGLAIGCLNLNGQEHLNATYNHRCPRPQGLNGNVFVVDSVYCYKHTDDNIHPLHRTFNTRFSQDWFLLETKSQNYLKQGWENATKTERILNSEGKPLTETLFTWNENKASYVPASRFSSAYDNQHRLAVFTFESYDENAGAWSNVNRLRYFYDNIDKPVRFLQQEWTSMAWVNQTQTLYAYNTEGQETSSLFQTWDTALNKWVHANRTFDTYANGLKISTTRDVWLRDSNAWVLSSRTVFEYGQNQLQERVLNQIWNPADSAWLNQRDAIFAYNSSQKHISKTERMWMNEQWVNFFRESRAYDTDGNNTVNRNEIWTGDAWSLKDSCRIYYSNRSTVSTQEVFPTDKIGMVNPVCAGQVVHLRTEAAIRGVRLFDLSGEIQTIQLINKNRIDIPTNLPSGLYILEIDISAKAKIFKKIIVQN